MANEKILSSRIHKTDHWIDDRDYDLKPDEASLKDNLASFSSIIKFGSTYWGGVVAFVVMVLSIMTLIYIVTHDELYEVVRTWVIGVVQAVIHFDGSALLTLIWRPTLVFILLGVAYMGLVKRYSEHKDQIHAWGLSFLIILLASINVKVGVEIINWSGVFWEDFKNKEVDKFGAGLIWFAQLAFFSIIVGTYRIYFSQMLQVRWRTWLTQNFSERYLSNKRFYHLVQNRSQDNPDQRIVEDLDVFTNLGIGLFFGFYLSALSVYEYSKALLKISGDVAFDLFGRQVLIPDYMFWAVIVYTLLGSTVIHFIGRRLVKINVFMQRYNANLRYHLIRAREYAEGIGFLQGGQAHISVSRQIFNTIRSNWFAWMKRIKYLGFGSSIYAQGGIIFPIVVAAPRYFSGEINFGIVMQVIRAFGELREALSWFIDNYDNLAQLRAASTRIFSLQAAMNQVDQFQKQSTIDVVANNTAGIALTHVSLNRPQFDENDHLREHTQVSGLDWQISQGQRWLVSGVSGSGKSTILRAIAGLWLYGRGRIDVPNKSKVQFLPQRPYFPLASLRDALAYPAMADAYNDAAYETVLEMSQLSHLKSRLSEVGNWGSVLSGGEQQRLAFARVFLQRPDYLFLDEATASLDPDNESSLYATLLAFLPNLTLVSISHHEQVQEHHNQSLKLVPNGTGGFKPQLSSL